jgi:C-terminal processing protease CtpA/Prc
MNIIYSDGKYKLAQDYLLNNEKIPKESVIEKVNNLKVDEYVKTLQTKQLLRYDEQLDKVYTENLLMSNPGDNVGGWDVEFLLPSNRRYKGKVKKIDGYKNPYISKDSKGKNIICKELDEQTGYIKVSSFLQEYIEDDKKAIQDFMNDSSGTYEKLIIDVRGNIGGEPSSWMDNIVRPLLKESVEINRITAVKKSYFTRMNVRYAYYRLTTTNHLLKKRINHITNIDKIEYDGLNESEWNVYKITQVLTPANNFSFDGQVYVLTDNDTLSAADSFVRAIKETKIGKVVGTNTLGWGNVFMQPNICALPISGLMLRFDIEMPYNSDGTINSINGVKPDVNLAPSTYPTPYPINYEVSTLLEDPWIVWVMNDR